MSLSNLIIFASSTLLLYKSQCLVYKLYLLVRLLLLSFSQLFLHLFLLTDLSVLARYVELRYLVPPIVNLVFRFIKPYPNDYNIILTMIPLFSLIISATLCIWWLVFYYHLVSNKYHSHASTEVAFSFSFSFSPHSPYSSSSSPPHPPTPPHPSHSPSPSPSSSPSAKYVDVIPEGYIKSLNKDFIYSYFYFYFSLFLIKMISLV